MIERDDFMNIEDFSIQELEEKCKELGSQYGDMMRILKEKKQEEENKKKEKLAIEKDARKKEVEAARDNLQKLVNAYLRDYGSISITNNSDEWPNVFGSKPWRWWL